ncbi:unnamed protein product [Nezara viridula]|uniref:Aminopeptidase P N-terminal domain-containing protein n=1 Tax=Nezara viridula TaxID=85310 RepID=A0A9P0H8X6_NEZVI|nr:unnamed protein product [Nezara viridula]
MTFTHYMKLVPAECDEKTRNYIEGKLNELDASIRLLKIKCGMCKVDRAMFKENREILAANLRTKFPNSMVLLKGNDLIISPDCSFCFQQDSYFYWAFGVEKPNLWGAVDVETAKSYIFLDCHVNKNISWKKKYKIDKVVPLSDMKQEISKLGRNIFLVLSNMDEEKFNKMSDNKIVSIFATCGIWMCNTVLTPIFNECRMVKSLEEQTIMAVAANLNSEGMVYVLRNMRPGLTGYSLGALFDLYTMSSALHVSRARPISCLAGDKLFCLDHRQSTFHLTDNLKSGGLCILDMGIAMRNYRTNLIVTVPVNGIFSDSQAIIYNIVLEMMSVMLDQLKPGIKFAQVANAVRKKMVTLMIQNFILEGTIDDIIDSGICDLFYPHGIGHFMGIDFYDCVDETDIQSKENNGVPSIHHLVAKEGMILALNSELFINELMIKKWLKTSAGVHLQSRYLTSYFGLAARIQDIVVIESHSVKLMSNLPRTIEDIQKTMSDKTDIPFKTPRICRSIERNTPETGKFPVSKRRETNSEIFVDGDSGYSVLKLRCDYEPKDEKRLDLYKALNVIKEIREWKPMKYLNQIMEEVYEYPAKIPNLLELVMIPLIPHRRRPKFLPFPMATSSTEARGKFREGGYGCPYFDWNENFESCMAIQETCLEE